ncbi:MAG: hypothetical protein GXP24_07890 [Planctomycetes bacterium]|nr:hypothetical protein [Planctomycetota bacterium]
MQFHRCTFVCWFFGGFALLLAIGTVHAQPAVLEQPVKAKAKASEGDEWVRLRRDAKNKPIALEVAIVRYATPKHANTAPAKVPEYVDLIGAIHVGDSSYYQELNRRFRKYDALLYELVAPEGTVIERGRGTSNAHPLGAMQNGMKSMLELEHQLEKVDYTRPNFVHADLSPSEFSKSMVDKNEGFFQLYCRMMGQAMAHQSQQAAQGESADVDIFAALFAKDRPRKLKIALAKQFASLESMLSGISGPEGSTLITERNKRALAVLRKQQAAGKRKIGIFYGAGHLTDMHERERLVEEFGLQPIGTVWLEAWDLRP